MARREVFLAGGTGYIGSRLAARLVARGHRVRALVRAGSEARVPAGCEPVPGDALDAATFADRVPPADTFVHLVGVSHPSPAKAAQFRTVDLASARAAADAAARAAVRHLVYVSVAHPAPVMKAYVEARVEAERLVRAARRPATTIVRPWYVLGPGHRWPYLLVPLYRVLERIPATRDGALRLGLVTLEEMLATLVDAVERPPDGFRIADVPAIRSSGVRRLPPPDAAGNLR
jgi:uncharacterized protein YbjT (DUF2867 family)